MTDTRDPRYAAVPRLGGGWGVIDYREGRYLEMTERSDEPQRQTAERLAGELNEMSETKTLDLAAIVAEIEAELDDSMSRNERVVDSLIYEHWPVITAALEERAELVEVAQRVAAINTAGNALPTWASEPIEELRRVLYGDKPFMPRES